MRPLALTMGDPAGIGPELVANVLATPAALPITLKSVIASWYRRSPVLLKTLNPIRW
jgi:4-hydroxy-L-threonine phosphate dehydrogenase PdxA